MAVSFVSTTNTARSLAGSVSLALALTLCRSPGDLGPVLSDFVGRHGPVVDLAADTPLEPGRMARPTPAPQRCSIHARVKGATFSGACCSTGDARRAAAPPEIGVAQPGTK